MKNALFTIFVVMICVVLSLTFFRVVYTGDTTQYIPSQTVLQALQDFNSDVMDNAFDLFTLSLRSLLDIVGGFTDYFIAVGTADTVIGKVLAVLEALFKSFEAFFRLNFEIIKVAFSWVRSLVLVFIDFLKLLDTILGVGAFVPWQT